MTDEDVVRRFHSYIGFGSVYGPFRGKNALKPMWRWSTTSFEQFQATVAHLWPWLGQRRRAKAKTLLLAYHAYEPKPKGPRVGSFNAPQRERNDEIRRLLADGATPKMLAEQFGVSGTRIGAIKRFNKRGK